MPHLWRNFDVGPMSIPTTISWPKEWGIDPDAFKSPSDLLSAVTAKFDEFQKQFSEVVTQHQRDLPHLLALMITHSWYPDFHFPIADSRALERCAVGGDFPAIERYLINYYRANAPGIEKRLLEEYPVRAPLLAEAFSAYHSGRYALAIPVFLAQADGISEQILSKHFFIFRDSKPAAEQLIRGGKLTDYGRLLLDPLVQTGTIRDHTRTLGSKTDYLNRHAIMHGGDPNYGTETNALKSISLLAYLLLVNTFKA